jgi:hypothetical protein
MKYLFLLSILMVSISSCTVNPTKQELDEIGEMKTQLETFINEYTSRDTLNVNDAPIEIIALTTTEDLGPDSDIDIQVLQLDGHLYAITQYSSGHNMIHLESCKDRFPIKHKNEQIIPFLANSLTETQENNTKEEL